MLAILHVWWINLKSLLSHHVKGAVIFQFSQGLLTLMCNNSKLKADIIVKAIYKVFDVYMVAYHHPDIGLVDKKSLLTRECSVFSAVCLDPWQN